MTTVLKVVANNPPTSNIQVATTNAHSSSVPAGSVVLGSTGYTKPSDGDQTNCTVPVHIFPDNSVAFFFQNAWRRGDGGIIP